MPIRVPLGIGCRSPRDQIDGRGRRRVDDLEVEARARSSGRAPRGAAPASTRRRRRAPPRPPARVAACRRGGRRRRASVMVASGSACDSSQAQASPAMPPPTMRIRDPTMPTPFQDRDGFDTTGWERRPHDASRTGIRTDPHCSSAAAPARGSPCSAVRPAPHHRRHRRGPPRRPRPRRLRRWWCGDSATRGRLAPPGSARPTSRPASPPPRRVASPRRPAATRPRRRVQAGAGTAGTRVTAANLAASPGAAGPHGPRSPCRSRTSARPWPRCGPPPPPPRASCCRRTSAPVEAATPPWRTRPG